MRRTLDLLPPLDPTTRRCAALFVPVLLSWLVGCSSTPPATETKQSTTPAATSTLPEPAAASSVEPPAPARPSLAAEQRRFAALFRGTPVVFTMQPDGRLRVDVPLHHSFDAGRSAVRAPLGAVLDRVALSQTGASSRIVVSAPGDKIALPAKPASGVDVRRERLVGERGKAIVDRLVAKGIAPGRLSALPAASVGPLVRLLVDDRPAP